MARPVVGEVAEQIYSELGPYTVGDEESGWHLLKFVEAITGVLFEKIHLLVSDRQNTVGWEVLFDPDTCPAGALPYLAQYVGVTLEPSLTEQQKRDKIRLPENFKRGTRPALIQAVQRTLTGAKTILIDERFGGSAYALRVRTLTGETPNATATQAAVVSQKPGGLVLTYQSVVGQDWNDVKIGDVSWANVATVYPDWQAVKTTPP